MRRRLFDAAAAVLLVLYVVTLVAFARSIARSDWFEWHKSENTEWAHCQWFLTVSSGRGGVGFGCDAELYGLYAVVDNQQVFIGDAYPADGRWQWHGHREGFPRYPRPAFSTRERARLGFWFKWHTSPDTIRREIIVPYWFLAVVTGALPALWLVRRRSERVRRRRAAAGLCGHCGYDLRASGETCPECGARRPEGG